MVTLRLFHAADPFRPIETRALAAGVVEIGRDPGVDWLIEDVACELSRRHCALRVSDAGVHVRDLSANGVFVGEERRRLPRDVETLLAAEDALHLGQFMITVDFAMTPANDRAEPQGGSIDAPFHSPMLREPVLSAADFVVSDNWERPSSATPARAALPDAALLEAFCEGAGLDPSVFAGEDPADVMRRAGQVYRQAVLGLADLMGERTSLKSEFEMNRTRVSATENNPFKWADPHRVAVDLLRSGNAPFLSGGAAVNASFQDLKKHLLCLMAGSRAAVAAAFEGLSPSGVEEEAKGHTVLLKGEACWRAFQKRHASLVADARENAQSVINRAFKTGYERHVRKLDGLSTLS
ncbi:MAG: type VI secretion system-associated FHA domain protein TagH [Alphaproteobacteria bacterium]|nr:MAG: type VI secretion system-associated FHA domain protein TagH [Alphaproteobacteria bacterium]